MSRPLHTLRRSAVAFVLAAASIVGLAQAVRAQDSFTLAGNPDVRADRMALIREEFRERREEIREARERSRKRGKAHGKRAELAAVDMDLARPGTARFLTDLAPLSALSVPVNTKANDKTAHAAGAGQAEQSIIFLGQNGLCSWNDGQGFNLTPQDVQGWGYTTNGGATWTDGGFPSKGATTIATWSSDPVVCVNEKSAEFYVNGLTTNSGTNNNGVGVARGHFSGSSFVWDGTSSVVTGPSASQFFDKQWMCADSSNGNLYVTWTLFTTTTNIYFARSTDGGNTWSSPLLINGSWEAGLVSGSRPMVGPNGEVYVVYTAIGAVDADSVKIAKSTNAGASFAPAVVGMTLYDNYFNGAPGFSRPRAVTFAAGAVDRTTGPNRGRVYLTAQDAVNFYGDAFGNTGSKSEVEANSGFANATPFTVGQVLRGSMSSSTDQDWWKFPAVQGTTYLFYVDSLRTTSLRYTMRLYCGSDTTLLSRIGFSGAQSSTSSLNSHSLIVWTAPTTATYYLRMVPVTVGSGANNYRIRSATHTAVVSDVARDARDVVAASSANGVTGWSARKVMNDDAALYDNWLPEVVVGGDGYAYSLWMDFRDYAASCFGGSNMRASRSTDGGATWAANVVTTSSGTPNWTQVSSNISPNQGDYNGMGGGDAIGMAWGDGRLGDSDVYTARVPVTFTLGNCIANQTIVAGNSLVGSVDVNNLNVLYGNTYSYTVSMDHAWAGFPATGNLNVTEGGTNSVPVNIAVPANATHNDVVNVCVTVNQNGAAVQSCCFQLTVNNIVTPTLASLASSTAEPGRVSLRWLVDSRSSVVAYRSNDGVTWQSLGRFAPDAEGYVDVVDTDVQAGERYAYRLGLSSGSGEVFAGTSWIAVPMGAEFAIDRVFPSPAKSGFSVSFALPNARPATLELIDLAGRRVMSRNVGTMGAGRHTLSLESETAHLPIGVYGIRLSQDGKVATSKVSIVR